jgi:hypothetical protein
VTDSPNSNAGAPRPEPAGNEPASPQGQPVYSKPMIRKYNQIVQVKPYGPSEREAG